MSTTLLTPTSFCLLVWRRSETGDRFEKGERQSGYSCVYFVKYSQFTDSILLHRWFTLHRRDIPVSRNSFARCYGQFLRVAFINRLYRRVRPRRTACNPSAPCVTAGAAVGRPHNALPLRNSPFSIFNSPFVESPPQTVLEHFLYLKENHSTETILYADSQTASHKPNRAAAAPDTLRSISNTAA